MADTKTTAHRTVRGKPPWPGLALALGIALAGCGGGGGPAGTPILNPGTPGPDLGLGLPDGGTVAVEVTYAVTGSAPAADITYLAADGSSVRLTAPLPWSVALLATPGINLGVTARSTINVGTLTASIRTANVTLAEQTSTAVPASVTVTATCCTLPSR